jgi:hypothetical protein
VSGSLLDREKSIFAYTIHWVWMDGVGGVRRQGRKCGGPITSICIYSMSCTEIQTHLTKRGRRRNDT